MTKQTLSVRPAGRLFKKAVITVVRIHPDPFVPDYSEDEPTAVDLALVEFQRAMFDKPEQDLAMVREFLDLGGTFRFWQIGLRRTRNKRGTFSDFALAVVMLHQQSPLGIQYRFPDGHVLVFYRGHTYFREGNLLRLLQDDDQ